MNECLNFLLDASWRAALVFMPLYAIYRLGQGRLPASWRYGLWWLFLLRLALPMDLHTPWSVFQWWPNQAPIASAGLFEDDLRAKRLETSGVFTPAPAKPSQPTRIPIETGLFALWLLGLGWIGLATVRRLHRMGRITAGASEAPLYLQNRFATILGNLGLKHRPRLLVTSHVSSPVLWGLRRPNLLLPLSFVEQNGAGRHLDFVFTHEAGHLKRGDLWLTWLECLIVATFWFHPLVWLARKLMFKEREKACDAFALNALGESASKPYAYAILAVAGGVHFRPALAGMVHLSNSGRILKDRLRELKNPPRKLTLLPGFLWAACLAALAVCFLTHPTPAKAYPSTGHLLGPYPRDVALSLKPTTDTVTVLNTSDNGKRLRGKGISTKLLTQIAFGLDAHQVDWRADDKAHFVLSAKATDPGAITLALQHKLRGMGLQWHWTLRQDTVFLLQQHPSATHPTPSDKSGEDLVNQENIHLFGATTSELATVLQGFRLYHNVIDQSHLPGTFDFQIDAGPGELSALNQALANHGLQLVKTRAEVRVLVVTGS